ncbi:MetQ/NlpA family ABC transporter substrate-binding protein [Suttonella sp. R2A3]|uniref:MetQ/NlpA family ABC transporter substrate-binding protein n=1 Tax=Suttonella sp. R2A3 TaxID=2908648 RepID=UPI001F2E4F60|nr:MetQ/NlpA family ABC transporter substrate-binding protein [Suttonella sp. R2A3]UJF25070.1 MetQ/NlpA family ABC transporter substrate-binding protein [Suttonella sp. R2A3]
MNTVKTLSLAIIAALSFSAHADTFKVGTMSGKEANLLYAAQEEAKKQFDLDVEVVEFDDYVTPNIALADGSIDANAFQHGPYLDTMVQERGFDLVAVGNTFVYPIGAYSEKIESFDELEDGASIAIPNDPSNGARTLILMDKEGLITLKDNTNLEASVLDISENPHNYDIKEVDAAQLPRVLDEVDVAFINSNYAVDAGLVPTKDAILREAEDSPYVNIIVTRTEDKDKEAVKQFVQAYQTEAVEKAAEEAFKGAAVKGW